MAVLTTCHCVLKIKDQLGVAYSSAQLSYQPRRSQIHTSDALYIGNIQRSQAQVGIEIQDLLYIAKAAPTASITVAYTSGGTAGAEVVTVTDEDISVQIEDGVSTAAQVQAAITASVAASALVYCILSGTSSDAQTAVSATTLSDYYTYLPLAETVTDSQLGVFVLDYGNGSYYGSIVFDPVYIPDQSYLDLSSLLTISRG